MASSLVLLVFCGVFTYVAGKPAMSTRCFDINDDEGRVPHKAAGYSV
jgi:hypothetical protein